MAHYEDELMLKCIREVAADKERKRLQDRREREQKKRDKEPPPKIDRSKSCSCDTRGYMLPCARHSPEEHAQEVKRLDHRW